MDRGLLSVSSATLLANFIIFCVLGYMISTLSPTVATASSISAPLLLPLLLLGGFYVKNT